MDCSVTRFNFFQEKKLYKIIIETIRAIWSKSLVKSFIHIFSLSVFFVTKWRKKETITLPLIKLFVLLTSSDKYTKSHHDLLFFSFKTLNIFQFSNLYNIYWTPNIVQPNFQALEKIAKSKICVSQKTETFHQEKNICSKISKENATGKNITGKNR